MIAQHRLFIVPVRIAHTAERIWMTSCAFALLLVVTGTLWLFGFNCFHTLVKRWPTRSGSSALALSTKIASACQAIERASQFWPFPLLCLRRAAAAVCLLRLYGVPAELVIGINLLPFAAHAWAEVDGNAVVESAPSEYRYKVVDRC